MNNPVRRKCKSETGEPKKKKKKKKSDQRNFIFRRIRGTCDMVRSNLSTERDENKTVTIKENKRMVCVSCSIFTLPMICINRSLC